jgi:hypothetical protein
MWNFRFQIAERSKDKRENPPQIMWDTYIPLMMDGLIIIDKPAGLTSHDVVARARRITV